MQLCPLSNNWFELYSLIPMYIQRTNSIWHLTEKIAVTIINSYINNILIILSFIEIQNDSNNINGIYDVISVFDDIEYIRCCRDGKLWVFFELISNWRIESCGEQNTIDTASNREEIPRNEFCSPEKFRRRIGNRKLLDYVSSRHGKGIAWIHSERLWERVRCVR